MGGCAIDTRSSGRLLHEPVLGGARPTSYWTRPDCGGEWLSGSDLGERLYLLCYLHPLIRWGAVGGRAGSCCGGTCLLWPHNPLRVHGEGQILSCIKVTVPCLLSRWVDWTARVVASTAGVAGYRTACMC